ncbi:hypothetical protein [Amycolatopsis sp. NPDC051061]|uniref:hypothetical protein n=1 Tax=Amycolatopsis sp. NPDC051061 TaxID=3155042 RepID=UPI00341A88F2
MVAVEGRALALDGYRHAVEHRLDVADTGDIEADLRTQVRSFVEVLRGPAGRAIAELIGQPRPIPN